MPLYADGLKKIRRNLTRVQVGERLKVVRIGYFTAEQLTGINKARTAQGLPSLCSEIVFHGRHMYHSRCVENGYTIDQVLEQIQSAFSNASIVDSSSPSTVIRNPNARVDHEGKLVRDEAVFECTGRYPNADLFSVVPRGDGRLRPKKAKGPLEE
jgi:hypothetical protein